MEPVTEWLAFNDEERRFEFNHIECGHVPYTQTVPTPVCKEQKKAWSKQLWIRHHSYLDGIQVVRTTGDSK